MKGIAVKATLTLLLVGAAFVQSKASVHPQPASVCCHSGSGLTCCGTSCDSGAGWCSAADPE